ncbi:hypothetical protein ACFLXY_10565 [Chloroflexota bacterium]
MKKIVWLVLCCLMALTLLITSCDTTTTEQTVEEDEGDDVVKITESTVDIGTDEMEESVTPSSDEPQYGGTHNIALAWGISNWANGLEFC